jgi:hypothetical protein
VLALACAALALGACSVLVQPSDDRVRCEVVSGVDPCPTGQRCLEGFCTALPDGGVVCQEREIGCNGIDDDCDQNVDEGSDADGDGFTYCDPDPARRDCRDDNGAVNPGATGDPPCDGVDNDCDGVPGECPVGQACGPTGTCRVPDCTFAFMCPTNERCDTSVSPARCEAIATDCMLTGCPPGLVCDPLERTCAPPRQLGELCSADQQCMAGSICVARAALGLTFEDVGGDAVCSRTCCTDGDCGLGARCWVSGTGARGCVPESILRLGPQGVPTAAACSESPDCGANECALRSTPAYRSAMRSAYVCGAPVGRGTFLCEFSDDCRSGLCLQYCGILGCASFCSSACGASADCSSDETCGWADVRGGFLQTCLLGREGASAGAACSGDRDCRDDACIMGASGRYCADVCCSDEHCPAGSRCRPTANHGRWEMLCIRE